MSQLVFGFCGEGKRDYTFLKQVVIRTLQNLLPYIDILPFDFRKPESISQDDLILKVAKETYGYGLVVFHLDADAPTIESAYAKRFKPGYDRVQQSEFANLNKDIVPVIPVRNTEAWILADFEAFCEIVGTKLSAEALGFPSHPRQVEAIQDSKSVFENAVRNARPGRRRKVSNDDIDAVCEPLGIQIDMKRLGSIPAYREFVDRLKIMLQALHYSLDE